MPRQELYATSRLRFNGQVTVSAFSISTRPRLNLLRTNGPSYTSLGQRPRFTNRQFKRAEGPIHGLAAAMGRAYSPRHLADLDPGALPQAGMERAFGPDTREPDLA